MGASQQLMKIWKEWDIRILVVLSFTLQVILLVFAGTRRRRDSPISSTILLWLAYQSADSTAIYVLGNMSLSSSRSHDSQLVAFWAPFLLLHLGGPDTITSYALEDNRLWLRQLPTLLVQVAGVAYALYQYAAAGTLLTTAGILMFIAGFIKYGERIWARKCANMDSIGSSLAADTYEHGKKRSGALRDDGPYYYGRKKPLNQNLDAEEVLLGAHFLLDVCKSKFITDRHRMRDYEYVAMKQGIELNGDMYMYEVTEMELSLMYDMMYTKAAVIHTWYGCCIRFVSLLATAAAFILFQLSRKDAYHRVDIAVTYVLLVGALFLEIITVCTAAGSSWTCRWLRSVSWTWNIRLLDAVMSLRRLVRAARNRQRCLHSIGQYNMLDFCTRDDKADLRGRIAKKVGLGDRWNASHYSTTTLISTDMKELVLKEIRTRSSSEAGRRAWAWGRSPLEQRGLYKDLGWSTGRIENLGRSIIVWHLATDIYLYRSKEEPDADPGAPLPMAIKVLSNYMVYILAKNPDLLPGGRYQPFFDVCGQVEARGRRESTKEHRSSLATPTKKSEELALLMLPHDRSALCDLYKHHEFDGSSHSDAAELAAMLLCNKWNIPIADMLEVIAGVWVEMLCYAGHHCGEDSHARKLSSGCEFLTVAWLLAGQATMYDKIQSRPGLYQTYVHSLF